MRQIKGIPPGFTMVSSKIENRCASPIALCPTLVTLIRVTPVLADSPEQRGNAYAEARCARCHAIDRAGPSPLQIAPP
jgi:hypothetical protein